jgi:hypothetical protein
MSPPAFQRAERSVQRGRLSRSFRRLALRSATGTAQRAIPTIGGGSVTRVLPLAYEPNLPFPDRAWRSSSLPVGSGGPRRAAVSGRSVAAGRGGAGCRRTIERLGGHLLGCRRMLGGGRNLVLHRTTRKRSVSSVSPFARSPARHGWNHTRAVNPARRADPDGFKIPTFRHSRAPARRSSEGESAALPAP